MSAIKYTCCTSIVATSTFLEAANIKDTLSSAANGPTAPEAWYARLAADQTIVPSALARITPV